MLILAEIESSLTLYACLTWTFDKNEDTCHIYAQLLPAREPRRCLNYLAPYHLAVGFNNCRTPDQAFMVSDAMQSPKNVGAQSNFRRIITMQRLARACRLAIALVAAFVAGGIATDARAGFIVGWTGPNDGDGHLTNMDFSFLPVLASELTQIDGQAYSHNQGFKNLRYSIEVRLDSNWFEIDSWYHQDSSHHLLAERVQSGPLTFPLGLVDGLRLKNLFPVNFAYHDLYGTTFTFNGGPPEPAPSVPEPSSLVILGGGAIGLTISARLRASRSKRRNHLTHMNH